MGECQVSRRSSKNFQLGFFAFKRNSSSTLIRCTVDVQLMCRMPDSETQFFIVDASWEEIQAVKTNPSKRFEAPAHSHSIFKLAANVGNLSLNVFEKFVGKPLADTIASVRIFRCWFLLISSRKSKRRHGM